MKWGESSVLLRDRLLLGACALMGVVLLVSAQSAHAVHPYSGYRFQNDYVVWCLWNSMPSSWQNEIVDSVNTWNNPSDWFLAYSSVCGSAKLPVAKLSFSSNRLPPVPAATFRGMSGGFMTSAFVALNDDFDWTTNRAEGASMGSDQNPCNPSCDIETIALHEIGHAASFFNHPWLYWCPGQTSVMCVDFKVRRILNSHDISEVQAVY